MKRKLIVMGMIASLCISMSSGFAVQAKNTDEVEYETIYRPASGDLEELKGICVPQETFDGLKVEDYSIAVQQQEEISEDVQAFLSCGSEYGYNDMKKRSNAESRQALYRLFYVAAEKKTLNGEDAQLNETNNYNILALIQKLDEQGINLTEEELFETYFTFRNDNPQFFWLSNMVAYSTYLSTGTIANVALLTYDEYATGSVRSAALQEIMKTGEDVYLSQIRETDDTYTKVHTIHDALIQDIEYDYEHMNEIGPAHSIAGAMTSTKKAVCEGYAKVMQLMMNCYGINNVYVTGIGNGGGHAWNLVGMDDGKYYWLDSTWDDGGEGKEPYDFYFLKGNQNFTNHTVDTPDGQGTNFLYELPQALDTDYVYNPSEITAKKGDINGDNKIDIQDLMQCLNHVSQKSLLYGNQLKAADVDGSGYVDIQDLMKLLNYVSGKIATL